MSMPPTYEQSNNAKSQNQQSHPRYNLDDDDLALPSVPDVHPTSGGGGGAKNLDQSVDFDELAKRFENLKSKK